MTDAPPKPPISPKHAAKARADYESLIEPLREVARRHGYALAVHGSLARDIDLVAIPWQQICSHPIRLAEDFQAKIVEVIGQALHLKEEDDWWHHAGCPGSKPHGRLGWVYHLGGGPYVDLSVVPPREGPTA